MSSTSSTPIRVRWCARLEPLIPLPTTRQSVVPSATARSARARVRCRRGAGATNAVHAVASSTSAAARGWTMAVVGGVVC